MLHKILVATVLFFTYQNLQSQPPTAAELKLKKIKKVTISTRYQEAETTSTAIIFYDENGNDTARYDGASRTYYKKIQYNRQLKPFIITVCSNAGDTTDIITNTYKPDGSYTSTSTDKQYGFITASQYDKKGNLMQVLIPDGSIKKYNYNAKGELIKAFTIPKNGGVKLITIYSSNSNGKIATAKTSGDYKNSWKYTYGANNLLGLAIYTAWLSGEETETSIDTYVYGY